MPKVLQLPMIKSLEKCIFFKYGRLILGKKKKIKGLSYWEDRAKKYGKCSVINIEYCEEKYDSITKMQKDILFPLLKEQLQGYEKLILDFGCGPGRFTGDLADLIHGHTLGVEPVKKMIDLAPRGENVEYILIDNNIAVKDESIDIVWICLVLGGIKDELELKNSVKEIKRILKKNGLIFLVENTSEKKDKNYWKYRSVKMYQTLFYFADLKHLSDYLDKGERISVMAGRKRDLQENGAVQVMRSVHYENFTALMDKYIILHLDINDYNPSKAELPEYLSVEYGEPSNKRLKKQYKHLLKKYFFEWKDPYFGNLKGYRNDSLIRVMKGKELIAGGILCKGNQYDNNIEQGQLHYVFVIPKYRGRRIYTYLSNVAVKRAKEWGLKGIYFCTDRKGLPDVKRRWGYKEVKTIEKLVQRKSLFHYLYSLAKLAVKKYLRI